MDPTPGSRQRRGDRAERYAATLGASVGQATYVTAGAGRHRPSIAAALMVSAALIGLTLVATHASTARAAARPVACVTTEVAAVAGAAMPTTAAVRAALQALWACHDAGEVRDVDYERLQRAHASRLCAGAADRRRGARLFRGGSRPGGRSREARKLPTKSGTSLAPEARLGYRRLQIGDRLMVGQQPLELLIKVRILVPERVECLRTDLS